MLLIILVFAIYYYGVKRLLDLPFKKKIERSNSVKESLRARKELRIARPILSVLLIVIFCVVMLAIDPESGSKSVGMIIAVSIMEGFWSKMRGNVHANSKDGYLAKYKDKGYILYLRAFESDFYSEDPKAHSFEGDLAKAFEKSKENACAIGMTKELDAPYGAERVYVSDESWQSDVKELMQFAKSIIVLVSDRQSCIWEITQSVDLLHKTFFVIDNENKYSNVKNELQGIIHFPEYGELLQILANKREKWEHGKMETVAELNEKVNNGTIKVGLMINNGGFDVVKIDDLAVFAARCILLGRGQKGEKR